MSIYREFQDLLKMGRITKNCKIAEEMLAVGPSQRIGQELLNFIEKYLGANPN